MMVETGRARHFNRRLSVGVHSMLESHQCHQRVVAFLARKLVKIRKINITFDIAHCERVHEARKQLALLGTQLD